MTQFLKGRSARRWLDSLLADLRFAVRHSVRKPLTATTIIIVLSLGIGVHSAVFSLIQALTVKPAPGVPYNATLVRIRGKEQLDRGGAWFPRGLSYPEFLAFAAHRELFAAAAGWTSQIVALDLASDADAGAVSANFVTGDFFTGLGIRPALGTMLSTTPAADRGDAELVAVIGFPLWQSVFGGVPGVIGQTIRLNNVPVRIVGVAPERFNGATQTAGSRSVWLPLSARAVILHSSEQALTSRDTALFQAFARLENGVPAARANSVVRTEASKAVAQMAARARGSLRDADVVALRGDTELPENSQVVMAATVYGSLALLILLITCTNVSALVVGSAMTRRQEIAVRLSLGASRKRVVRQLLTESMLLSTVAGAMGLAIYWGLVNVFASRLPEIDLAPNFATVAFTMCFALGTGVLFGLSPALHATKRGLSETLKDSGRSATGKSRLQQGFVVAQIVLTQPLLAGLAMMIALVMRDTTEQVGDDVAQRIISLRLHIVSTSGTPQSYQKQSADLEAAMQRVAIATGVTGIVVEPAGAMISNYTVKPLAGSQATASAKTLSVHVEATSPGYFPLINVPIKYGRDLVAADTAASELPVVIGSDMALDLFGNLNPVGRRFTQHSQNAKTTEKDAVIVGVYDARFPTTRGPGRVYAPQDHRLSSSFLIRTDGLAAPRLSSVRAAVRAELPRVAIARLQTLADVNAVERADILRVGSAAASGGLFALLLASIGLYGVVALALGQRQREIGIRMALGARPQQVVAMLFGNGVILSVIGLALGLPLSIFALRILAQQALLPNISLLAVGAGIAAAVLAVASLATWLPARRAASVDPVTALRVE